MTAFFVRRLLALGKTDLLTATHAGLHLTDQTRVRQLLGDHRIGDGVLAADKLGGIHANGTYLAEFSKAKVRLGCSPKTTAHEVCAEVVVDDLRAAQRRASLKAYGHVVPVSLEAGR